MLRRLVNILAAVSLIVLLAAAGLGTATHFFSTSSTNDLSPTTQRQTVFANGQFLIHQTQTTLHPDSIEHSSHTVFKIDFWSIIPWTLIFPILRVRYVILRRKKTTPDPAVSGTTLKSNRKSSKARGSVNH